MKPERGLVLCAAFAAAGAFPSGLRAATPPASQSSAQQQLLEEVRQLRAEVQELKAERDADHVAAVRNAPAANNEASESVEVTKAAVAADASHRNILFGDMDSSFTGGYAGDRFVLQSGDGKFVFRPWLHMQARYIVNNRQNFKIDGTDETDQGFEMRRMRFGFDGNMFGTDLTYLFNWATVRASGTATVTNGGRTVGTVSNNLGGTPLLEEAWVRYKIPETHIYLRGGQIKDPILHDQIVSSRYQQSAERSLTGDIFTNGDAFTEGATIAYDPDSWFRAETGVNHGLRSANTNFLDYPNTNAFNFGVVGRADFKLMGKWKDYGQIGGQGTKEPLLVAGIGADVSERGHSNQTVGAVDVMYVLPEGLNLYGALVDRYTDHNFGFATQSAAGASITAAPVGVANTATNEYSLEAEAGYLIKKHWEPFARFEYMKLQGTPAGSHNYVPAIFGGLNYYFFAHRAKLTGEGIYLPRGIPIDDTPNDVLASPSGHGEFVFLVQFQFLL